MEKEKLAERVEEKGLGLAAQGCRLTRTFSAITVEALAIQSAYVRTQDIWEVWTTADGGKMMQSARKEEEKKKKMSSSAR